MHIFRQNYISISSALIQKNELKVVTYNFVSVNRNENLQIANFYSIFLSVIDTCTHLSRLIELDQKSSTFQENKKRVFIAIFDRNITLSEDMNGYLHLQYDLDTVTSYGHKYVVSAK